MEVNNWPEDYQLTQLERQQGQGNGEEDVVGIEEKRQRERSRYIERGRQLTGKHVDAEIMKRPILSMNFYRTLEEGKEESLHSTLKRNVDEKVGEKMKSREDGIERHKIKNEEEKGEKKPPLPSGTNAVERKFKDDVGSDKQRKEGKRPCLEENIQGVLHKSSRRNQYMEVTDEGEEVICQNRLHVRDADVREHLEMSDVASTSQCKLVHQATSRRYRRRDQDAPSGRAHRRQGSPSEVQAFTASQHNPELLQKVVKQDQVDQERKPQAALNRLADNMCDFEFEELKVIGGEREKVCRRQTCDRRVTPRPHRIPETVSIWALPVEDPSAVKLTALKPQDVVNSSVMEIRVAGLRSEQGSVTDPRLGPAQMSCNIPCATCLNSDCLGHGGYIDLREYVFHPTFVTRCVQTLRKLCYHCLGPAVRCQRNMQKIRKAKAAQKQQPSRSEMWLNGCAAEPVENCKPRLCDRKQPKYHMVVQKGVKTVEVVMPVKEQKVVALSASIIRAIFAEVSESTWQYLGMKDPSDELFLRYLRVCPTLCRSATEKDGHLSPNHLTVLYNNVVTLRNEVDRINLQMEELMASQDKVVRGGVHMLLWRQVDALDLPWQSTNAFSVVLNDGQRARASKAVEEDNDNKNVSRKQVISTADAPREDVTSIPDASPVGMEHNSDDLPNKMNFISEDELEGTDEGEEKYLDKHNNSGKKKEGADKATASSTPPLAEWLLTREDEDKMDVSGHEEEEKDGDAQDGDEGSQTDRLQRMRHQVEEVARQLCQLHQQARLQHLALTSAVATVVLEQMNRIPGKQGVMRHSMLGKRVNQCARAVFTGDNSLPLGVVGVPRAVATKLFQYVHVHNSNLKCLQEMIDRFPEYPCVVSVTRGERHFDMQTLSDKMAKRDDLSGYMFCLQAGDVAQRHLMDGDQVMVNRQPTLAKANVETHTVRVTNTHTISLNISITDNYAADCDGDEMNLFVPGVESHSSRLLDVSHNAIFSKSGKVSQKIKQDALRGAYAASLRDTFFTLEEFTALMPSGSQVPPPALMKPRRLWTGLKLLSLALPLNLTVDQCGVAMQLDTLVVRHGHLLSGVFDKSGQDKILECCKMFLGREVIMTTVKLLQSIAERFVDEVGGIGFTFLPEDWSCSANTLDTMRKELHNVLSRAQNIQCPQRRNAKLRQSLADQAKRLVPELPRENNAAAMLKAGSKKRPQKLVQVCLAVGQHNLNDQLPPKHLDGRRLLPFFSKDDTRPQAEGFVDQPLFGVGSVTADALSGMVARSSAYKKHCATGESGYLQRKLGKLMEDLTVRHDGTVRDANNEIVQLLYGDDGLLPECCFTVTLRTEPLPDHVAHFYQKLIGDQCLSAEEQLLLKEELRSLWSDQQRLSKEAKGGHVEASVPFHLPHLMAHVLATVTASGPPPSIADITGSLNKFLTFLEDSIEKPMNEELQRRKEAWEMVVEARRQMAAGVNKADYPLGPQPCVANGETLFEVNVNREIVETGHEVGRGSEQRLLGDPLYMLKRYVRQHVNTFSIRKAAFSKQQFSALLETMTELYQESRPAAGECVGALAAQALAEPLMQMTLNACHRAAVASDGDAIPRLTELLNGQAKDAVLEMKLGGLLQARRYLMQEISQVYAASGEAIDMRHVRLVVDYMLKDGTMNGFTRGRVAPQASFLKAAAFEQPLNLLQHAGTRGRGDGLVGVSENILLDNVVDVGPDTFSAVTWLQPQRDDCLIPSGQPQPDTQPPHDELSGAPHQLRGQLAYDLDDEDTCSVPEPSCLVEGTGQAGSPSPVSG